MTVHIDLTCSKCRRRFGLQVDLDATEVACTRCGATVDVTSDLAVLRRAMNTKEQNDDEQTTG